MNLPTLKPFDADGAFCIAAPQAGELRRHGIQGAGASLLATGSALLIQMFATVILGRLLTPTDYGVVTMVTTFSLLLANFAGNGFPAAIVQRKEIDRTLASNVFWIAVGVNLALAVLFTASGSLLARFFGDPRVTLVAAVMSLAILLNGTWVAHTALLQRAMRFPLISANQTVARAVSVATSVLLAWRGWGYWALVAGAIVLPLSTTLGAWWLCRWVPRLPQRAHGTGAMVRYAISVYGRFSAGYCAQHMDNVLVGWRFSALSLGLYKKAYDLFALSAVQLVSPLAMVAASTLSQLDVRSSRFQKYLLNAITLMAFVGMGLSGALTLVGTDVIRVLLGPGWEESGRIFTLFGPGIGAMLIYGTHGWVHLSIGTPGRWFRWGIVEIAITALLFLVALPWGPAGIASAWTASYWILTVPAFSYAGKPIGLAAWSVVAVVWRYVLASVLAGLAASLLVRFLPLLPSTGRDAPEALARIITICGLFAAVYVAGVILLHRGPAPLYLVAGVVQEIVPWSKNRNRFHTTPSSDSDRAEPVAG